MCANKNMFEHVSLTRLVVISCFSTIFFRKKGHKISLKSDYEKTSNKRKKEGSHWCFEPTQPLGIISGLKETFTKRLIVERTNKAEIRPEEQCWKAESCQENLWNEIQLKGP